jgi:hypothetical protein
MEVIHEYRGSAEHRIVVKTDDGKVTEGRWVPLSQTAQTKGYYATTHVHEGNMPVGVLRINHVPHRVVNVDDGPYESELRLAIDDAVQDLGISLLAGLDEAAHELLHNDEFPHFLSRECSDWLFSKDDKTQIEVVSRLLPL